MDGSSTQICKRNTWMLIPRSKRKRHIRDTSLLPDCTGEWAGSSECSPCLVNESFAFQYKVQSMPQNYCWGRGKHLKLVLQALFELLQATLSTY